MNNLIIKSMTLHYFKGIVNQTIEFSEGTTVIAGPNGSGKSTIADAFYWCLWGKNAAGQTSFGIKTVDADGNEIPHVDHEVSIEIQTATGNRQTFTRNLQPKYDKDDRLKGNEVAYSWNGVPIKKSEYDAKVAAIISEEVFRLTTSTTAFMAKKADDRRAILLKMAGDITDEEVSRILDKGGSGDYHNLIMRLNGITIEQMRKQIDSQIRKVNEALQTIPARIDEVKRYMPEAPDTEALNAEKVDIEQQIAEITKAANDTAETVRQANAGRDAVYSQIAELQEKQHEILDKAQAADRMAIHKANQVAIQAETDIQAIQGEDRAAQQKANTAINQMQYTIECNRKAADAMEEQLTSMREEWMRVSNEQFEASPTLACPLYGHTCTDCTATQRYDGNQQEAFDAFEERRAKRLQEITATGQRLNAELMQLQTSTTQMMQDIEKLRETFNEQCADRHSRINALRAILASNPKRPLISTIQGSDLPEWVSIQQKVDSLKQKAKTMTAEQMDNSWKDKVQVLNRRIYDINSELTKIEQIAAANARIDSLETELRANGNEKTILEHQRRMLAEFEQTRMDIVSDSINGLFQIARWQMWTLQVNGEKKDDCVCLCNGVRYEDANTASRINTGIDIAYTISKHLAKCTAPMFIDNGESITDIYNPGTQQIILRVDGSKPKMEVAWC